MKQHITPKQLNELSKIGKEKLRKWWEPRRGDRFHGKNKWFPTYVVSYEAIGLTRKNLKKQVLPLLSLGQMLEFLEKRLPDVSYQHEGYGNGWSIRYGESDNDRKIYKNLADVLWEACKEILCGS